MNAQVDGKVNVESYTFDQETAREELGNMIVLHGYPLSIVDHAEFRRKDIIKRHDKEKKKAHDYMTMLQSRVAVTIDIWTTDNQKKGYMVVMGHFNDVYWKLRSILMGRCYC
uniref:Uncharacterized protein n=1 Tax=Avena sativa TaxID=4498 RepID=A0ACD5WGF0_AVESA